MINIIFENLFDQLKLLIYLKIELFIKNTYYTLFVQLKLEKVEFDLFKIKEKLKLKRK